MIQDFRAQLRPKANATAPEIEEMCKRGEVAGAISALKKNGQPLGGWIDSLQVGMKKMLLARRVNELMSILYKHKIPCQYDLATLLRALIAHGDVPGFLKQIERSGSIEGFEREIDDALKWLRDRHQLDTANAYERKFRALRRDG